VAVDEIGVLWALGAALGFGLMHVVTRRVIARIQPVLVNALRLWLSVAILVLLPGRAGEMAGLPRDAWLLAGTAALFGPFLARIAIMSSVRHIQASHASLITLLTPVFAFPLELIVLGTRPGRLEVIGGAIILAGIAIPAMEMARRSRETVGQSPPT
jgi:drug/metabolite transporter (DMT)-like permease